MQSGHQPTCLIVGAGDGLGAGLARVFAREGLTVCLTRRPRNLERLEALAESLRAQGGKVHAFGVDARDEAQMIALVADIEARIGPLEVVCFNIGANVRYPIVETTHQVWTKVWQMAADAGFLAGREAARVMIPRGRGTIIFTGATASLRGRDGFAAFAGAKHALRALAQSMARELGPKGIHVAHVVIDGMVEGDFIRSLVPDYETARGEGRIVAADEAAQTWVHLWRQGRSAWTHELDIRPWSEAW